MAKVKSVYICQNCGYETPKWEGQCRECGEWHTLVEEISQKSKDKNQKRGATFAQASASQGVVSLGELEERVAKRGGRERVSTGSDEFDRVLGGGIVPGSVILVGGEPGVGKSTLLTQLAMQVGKENSKFQISNNKQKTNPKSQNTKQEKEESGQVLYVCGEESVEQVGMRVKRLKKKSKAKSQKPKDILLLAETNVDVVVGTAEKESPQILIIDSIQTLFTDDLTGMTGSVGQVRESAHRLIEYAKHTGTAVFIVGHVTKQGNIAGPKVLEHMVDVVLTLEGERTGRWRILRTVKNRFGTTDEVGVFSMQEAGLIDVKNPSGAFLEESQEGVAGRAVVVLMEGTRPILVEVQALVVDSQLAVPRRVAQGVAMPKLQVLTAVLQKHARLPIGTKDVFVNVVGGLKVDEPAADLGIALALASSVKGKPLPEQSVVVGEVGLLGEIRSVPFLKKRVSEAKGLGYTEVISPETGNDIKAVLKRMWG